MQRKLPADAPRNLVRNGLNPTRPTCNVAALGVVKAVARKATGLRLAAPAGEFKARRPAGDGRRVWAESEPDSPRSRRQDQRAHRVLWVGMRVTQYPTYVWLPWPGFGR